MLSIISTVGTSVFGRPGTALADAAREFDVHHSDFYAIQAKDSFPGYDIYQQALDDLRAKRIDFLRKACAEINGIEGIHQSHGVAQGNEYYFLATYTAPGILAARVLADFCQEKYQATKTRVEIIQGLQVKDPRKFRLTGLPSLVQKVYELLDAAKLSHLIAVLNATGGFKATIPYLTLVGMLRQAQGVEVSCIHEFSDELITLASLPIRLDIEVIKSIQPLLEKCDEGEIDRGTLLSGLGLGHHDPIETHSLWSLFEHFDGDYYILSGLGSIALAELRARSERMPVYLSKQAADRYAKSVNGSEEQRNFEKILNNIHDAQLRQNNVHTYPNAANALVYKLGRQKERAFYLEKGDHILVIELCGKKNESEYDVEPLPAREYSEFKLWESE